MSSDARQSKILEMILETGEVTVNRLAKRFNVSEMTIRRDLVCLERQGELIRTHGGAVVSKSGAIEFEFHRKGRQFAREKQAIAREAVKLVQPGMTVTLDTGTTTLEVAKALTGIHPLTVLTSSLAIASALYAFNRIELVLLGGTARKGSPDLTGWLTEENLKRFRVNLAFVGSDSVSPEGLFTTDMNVARVSQAMIAGADLTILVVDRSKFEKTSFVRFALWNEIDCTIVDSGLSAKARKWLKTKSRQVTYVRV